MLHELIRRGIVIGLISGLAFSELGFYDLLIWYVLAIGSCMAASSVAYTAARKKGQHYGFLEAQLIAPLYSHNGIAIGAMLGSLALFFKGSITLTQFSVSAGIGLSLGMAMVALRRIPGRLIRQGTILLIAASAVFTILYFFEPAFNASNWMRVHAGIEFILAACILTILVWIGRTQESELEAGIVCMLLAMAFWMLLPQLRILALALPVLLFLYYTAFILPQVQSYKQLLYGYLSEQNQDRAGALESYVRATRMFSGNKKAHEEIRRIHRTISLHDVHQDPKLLKLLDFHLCLNRVRENLLTNPVTPAAIDESLQLLALIQDQQAFLLPELLYWRSVAHLHGKEFDKAEQEMRQILDRSGFGPDQEASLSAILPSAWHLALVIHPEMKRRVGFPLLKQGRRLDAISVIETALERSSEDESAKSLKNLIYQDVTLAEYEAEAGTDPLKCASQFDHAWCWDHAKLKFEDPNQWRRGVELARIALRSKPEHAASMWNTIASTAQKFGDISMAEEAREKLLTHVRIVGLKDVSEESREIYFQVLRQRGENAYGLGNVPLALESLLGCLEDPRSGVETTRMIADLYQHQGDVVGTLIFNERALVYDSHRPEFLDRKDQVYYSLTPAELKKQRDRIGPLFDFKYLSAKSKTLIEMQNAGEEQILWGKHLAELMRVVKPESIAAISLLGRAAQRMGQKEEAISLLQQAHQMGKEKQGGEDAEAWLLTCRILGDIYLEQGNAESAIACFNDFKSSSKSGAETLYKLAQAHEKLGDKKSAINYFKHVSMYDNPLAWDAKAALQRLGASM